MALLQFQEPRQVIEALNRRPLRIVFHDKDSTYKQLLDKSNTTSLYNKRIQSMLTTIYKCLHLANYPKYFKELLTVRLSIYNLKGTDILSLPKPATTTYGLHSFKYCAVKLWNSLPDNIRRECTLTSFKRLLKTVRLFSRMIFSLLESSMNNDRLRLILLYDLII